MSLPLTTWLQQCWHGSAESGVTLCHRSCGDILLWCTWMRCCSNKLSLKTALNHYIVVHQYSAKIIFSICVFAFWIHSMGNKWLKRTLHVIPKYPVKIYIFILNMRPWGLTRKSPESCCFMVWVSSGYHTSTSGHWTLNNTPKTPTVWSQEKNNTSKYSSITTQRPAQCQIIWLLSLEIVVKGSWSHGNLKLDHAESTRWFISDDLNKLTYLREKA